MTVIELWRREVRGTPRRRVVGEAIATFVLGCVLIALDLVGTSGLRIVADVPPRWAFLVPLAASCLLLLAKRTHPGTAALLGSVVLAGDVAIGGSIGVIVAYFDLVYCVALWGRQQVLRRAEIAVGAGIALAGATCFVATGELTTTALVVLFAFALFATPLWWGRSVRSQKELARMASARTEDLRRLAELREEEVVRDERSRMAHELHDSLAGDLAAIGIHAEAALAGTVASAEVRPSLETIREASLTAADELRAMVRILRSGDGERTAPARLVEIDGVLEQARQRGTTVEVDRPQEWPALPAATDHAAFRIVQEALTNATKHAPGTPVHVSIEPTATTLELHIHNAVTDPRDARSDGVGLVSMRERTTALGGSFAAGRHDDGWRVQASLPIAGDDEQTGPDMTPAR